MKDSMILEKMRAQKSWTLVFGICIATTMLVESRLIIPKDLESLKTEQIDSKKRPFCNAFTGCGRKRTDPEMNDEQQVLPMENSLSDLLDLNSEPAVEDLMRQIMSQAKLWEAIQEASKEIYSQQNSYQGHANKFPISFNAQ